ncbi:hypothetical protein AGMMS50239_11620 [Bacteroidia bacterium]|nr:hypothetical protein AGMMS50239_11620 [Bacteroidia bacterium]GHV30247.1 hypothetical protein FACS1894177_02490 [Bacteroidia bacterium]
MVHTVYLDDATINGRKMLKELRRYKKGIQFDSSSMKNIVPEGYMTGEEFRKRAITKVNIFCDKNGIL